MANQYTRYATVATVDTAGEGYVVLPTIFIPGDLGAGGLGFSGTNQTWAWQLVLPYRITFSKMVTEVTVGGAATKKYGVGIYDKDKNLIIETGAIDAEAVAITSTTVTTTTLEPGTYYSAQTCDDAATQFLVTTGGAQEVFDVLNKNANRGGLATAGSAGVLPATLGTITPNASRRALIIILEP